MSSSKYYDSLNWELWAKCHKDNKSIAQVVPVGQINPRNDVDSASAEDDQLRQTRTLVANVGAHNDRIGILSYDRMPILSHGSDR